MSHNWVSIPFPANIHYSAQTQVALSQPIAQSEGKGALNVLLSHSGATGYVFLLSNFFCLYKPTGERWYDLVYIGTDHVSAKQNKLLRGILRKQCMRATDPVFFADNSVKNDHQIQGNMHGMKQPRSACWLGLLDSHASETSPLFRRPPESLQVVTATDPQSKTYFQSSQPAKSSSLNAHQSSGLVNQYSPYCHGRLCLAPGGDFPTRKAVFDALLCGCIPVTFQRATAQAQWPWHWIGPDGRNLADEATVFISRESFLINSTQAFDELLQLARNDSFLATKRKALESIRSQMQYRVPGGYPLSSVATDSGTKDDNALPDAVDVILSNLFKRQGM